MPLSLKTMEVQIKGEVYWKFGGQTECIMGDSKIVDYIWVFKSE